MFDLDRFKSAQDRPVGGFSTALAELRAGRKRSHWIWYILPQLAGLGHSATALHYGLNGVAEAMAYLQDSVLRSRLVALTDTVIAQLNRRPAPPLTELMGSEIVVLKLVSSMTLFREVARRLSTLDALPDYTILAANADAILHVAGDQGVGECQATLSELGSRF
jgi:uncharacterized protein (DUF1810 family)